MIRLLQLLFLENPKVAKNLYIRLEAALGETIHSLIPYSYFSLTKTLSYNSKCPEELSLGNSRIAVWGMHSELDYSL
jgi:hypothetical protein